MYGIWYLAEGTNQNTDFESNLAEVGSQVLTPALYLGRASGFFGAEVSIPSGGSVQDRLVGYQRPPALIRVVTAFWDYNQPPIDR